MKDKQPRRPSKANASLDQLHPPSAMDKRAKPNVKMRTLTAAMKSNQEGGLPLHLWPLAGIPARSEWIDNYKTVEQFMAVDLFTVRPQDVLDLAASLMHWRHVRHVPVEDDAGHGHRHRSEMYRHVIALRDHSASGIEDRARVVAPLFNVWRE